MTMTWIGGEAGLTTLINFVMNIIYFITT